MRHVVGALLYLRFTSLENALRSRLMRLKQPRYLVGALVGVAYFYFVFFRRVRPGRGAVPQAAASLAASADVLQIALALAAMTLTVIAVLCWIGPRARASLSFTEAEIAFLFPAPLSRRALVHYRLVSLQLGTLLTALVFALISSRWSFLPGGAAIRIAGWWIVLATVTLHITGSSFAVTRLLDRGITPLRRALIVLAIVALAGALAVAWPRLGRPLPAAPEAAGLGPLIGRLAALLDGGPLYWSSWPARCVVRPLFSRDAAAFGMALVPALLVYAAHYYWVLHLNVSFEEASIELAAKRAERLAALRQGRRLRLGRATEKARRDPFRLRPAGRPEVAFLWKNLLSAAEYLRPRTALAAAGAVILGSLWLGHHPAHETLARTIGFASGIGGAYVLLFGPMFARQDFRRDLVNTDLLKSYPLRAWQVVAGELLTPLVVVTVLVWLLLLTAALLLAPPPTVSWLTPPLRAAVASGIGLAAPIVCALELLVVNAAALLLPAWLTPMEQRSTHGIEGMGLRIAFLIGLVLAMAVALLPATLAALLVFAVSLWLVGLPAAVVVAAVAALAALAVEIGAGVWWLGLRFERFDLSAELRP